MSRQHYTTAQLDDAFDTSYSLYDSQGYSSRECRRKAAEFVRQFQRNGFEADEQAEREYQRSQRARSAFDDFDAIADALPRMQSGGSRARRHGATRYAPSSFDADFDDEFFRDDDVFGKSAFDDFRGRTGLFGENSRTPFTSTGSSRGYYATEERRPAGSQRDVYDAPPRRSHTYVTEERCPRGSSRTYVYSSSSSSSRDRSPLRKHTASQHRYPDANRASSAYTYSPDDYAHEYEYEYDVPPRSSHRGYSTQERRPGTPPHSSTGSGAKPAVCFYAVLGVPRTASSAEIKKAHRKLSMKWHPDRVGEADKERATKKMAEINQANDVLGDEGARAFYDRTGEVRGVDL